MSGPFGPQWTFLHSSRHLLRVWQASLLCPSAPVSATRSLLSLWASSLQDHPSLHWPLRDWEGRRAFFWLNKDFLIDTLTWPVVFGEGLQRQLPGPYLSPVDLDTAPATHSQELDPKQGLLHAFFSVTSFHNLGGLGLARALTPPLIPAFPVTLVSVPHGI